MKILILSFYYYPDLSAGSFRCTSLVKQLQNVMPDANIEIITTLPNRYASFNPNALEIENKNNIEINRIKLPEHQSGMMDQAKAFIYYAKHTLNLTNKKQYDLVFATSSRLMTATLGAWIARRKKLPLYLDIRDLFVDTISNVLPKYKIFILKPIFSLLERWIFNQASKINVVSPGFKPYFDKKYPKISLSCFTNGIDDEFIKASTNIEQAAASKKILSVIYAGNIGEGQGLHLIIPQLAKSLEGKVVFKILGAGGKLNNLKNALMDNRCDNVVLLPPVDRNELMKHYQDADILFLHLNNYDAFKKVLPSKLFEYASLGKPIWAGVSGYPADFIKTEISNAAVFMPGNASDAIASLDTLRIETQQRMRFIEKYKRENIMHAMSKDIESLTSTL